MKKRLLKLCALIFCAAFLMVGCTMVSNVKINGKDAYFSELQYNQGAIIKVGNYIYFGNGYTDSTEDGFNYNDAKKSGYLARLDVSKALKYDKDVTDEQIPNTSPKGAEKVLAKRYDKHVGFQYQNMYALGEYIYFASPSTHKSSSLENDYTKVSLYRTKFTGYKAYELVKDTEFTQGEGSSISVIKSGKKYFYVIVEPGENSTFTIKTIQIGDKIGKLKTLVKDVQSYCLPDENSSTKEIIYTVASDLSRPTTAIKSVDIASGKKKDIDSGEAGSSASMLARVGDVVFYSYTDPDTKAPEVYYKDIANSDNYYKPSVAQRFYNATSISDVRKAGEGYIFKISDGALVYKTLTGDSVELFSKDEFSDILFVIDDVVYISTNKAIKKISTIDKQAETILELTSAEIISGMCGYDGEYIYYYSTINSTQSEDGSETQSDDSNYYLYRTDKSGNYRMIGKTL